MLEWILEETLQIYHTIVGIWLVKDYGIECFIIDGNQEAELWHFMEPGVRFSLLAYLGPVLLEWHHNYVRRKGTPGQRMVGLTVTRTPSDSC